MDRNRGGMVEESAWKEGMETAVCGCQYQAVNDRGGHECNNGHDKSAYERALWEGFHSGIRMHRDWRLAMAIDQGADIGVLYKHGFTE